jgi:hypothetical protein
MMAMRRHVHVLRPIRDRQSRHTHEECTVADQDQTSSQGSTGDLVTRQRHGDAGALPRRPNEARLPGGLGITGRIPLSDNIPEPRRPAQRMAVFKLIAAHEGNSHSLGAPEAHWKCSRYVSAVIGTHIRNVGVFPGVRHEHGARIPKGHRRPRPGAWFMKKTTVTNHDSVFLNDARRTIFTTSAMSYGNTPWT